MSSPPSAVVACALLMFYAPPAEAVGSFSITTRTPGTKLVTSETGQTAEFTVVMDTPPTGLVEVGVEVSDETEGRVGVRALTFMRATWNRAQTVTCTGVDDAEDDGNVEYTVRLLPAVSMDVDWDGVDAPDVGFVNLDDEFNECRMFCPTCAGSTCSAFGQLCEDVVPTPVSLGDWVCVCRAPSQGRAPGAPAECVLDECSTPRDSACPTCAGDTCAVQQRVCVDPSPTPASRDDWTCALPATPVPLPAPLLTVSWCATDAQCAARGDAAAVCAVDADGDTDINADADADTPVGRCTCSSGYASAAVVGLPAHGVCVEGGGAEADVPIVVLISFDASDCSAFMAAGLDGVFLNAFESVVSARVRAYDFACSDSDTVHVAAEVVLPNRRVAEVSRRGTIEGVRAAVARDARLAEVLGDGVDGSIAVVDDVAPRSWYCVLPNAARTVVHHNSSGVCGVLACIDGFVKMRNAEDPSSASQCVRPRPGYSGPCLRDGDCTADTRTGVCYGGQCSAATMIPPTAQPTPSPALSTPAPPMAATAVPSTRAPLAPRGLAATARWCATDGACGIFGDTDATCDVWSAQCVCSGGYTSGRLWGVNGAGVCLPNGRAAGLPGAPVHAVFAFPGADCATFYFDTHLAALLDVMQAALGANIAAHAAACSEADGGVFTVAYDIAAGSMNADSPPPLDDAVRAALLVHTVIIERTTDGAGAGVSGGANVGASAGTGSFSETYPLSTVMGGEVYLTGFWLVARSTHDRRACDAADAAASVPASLRGRTECFAMQCRGGYAKRRSVYGVPVCMPSGGVREARCLTSGDCTHRVDVEAACVDGMCAAAGGGRSMSRGTVALVCIAVILGIGILVGLLFLLQVRAVRGNGEGDMQAVGASAAAPSNASTKTKDTEVQSDVPLYQMASLRSAMSGHSGALKATGAHAVPMGGHHSHPAFAKQQRLDNIELRRGSGASGVAPPTPIPIMLTPSLPLGGPAAAAASPAPPKGTLGGDLVASEGSTAPTQA